VTAREPQELLGVANETLGEVRGVCGAAPWEQTALAVRRVVRERDEAVAEVARVWGVVTATCKSRIAAEGRVQAAEAEVTRLRAEAALRPAGESPR
jgi:hypothetical protein